ncbi:MAG: putative Na+/H+ antiporter, partial [Zoogloeaceae bacterium]|nr:putative Na+/H+ antiporter [Zoogloeaceae bacterium]
MTIPHSVEIVGALLFAIAILHTFSTRVFDRLARTHPRHAGVWRLLAEVEVVFGFWAMILILFMAVFVGRNGTEENIAVTYLEKVRFTEPLFVFAIMVVAASKPILRFATGIVGMVARFIPFAHPVSTYFTLLGVAPLLGSFITEPAAMTLTALMLRELFYSKGLSKKLKYVTIGTLFVNVSIGGTLTNFAAPPVLMVAKSWDWNTWYMLSHIGWKSALTVMVNAGIATLIFRKELARIPVALQGRVKTDALPVPIVVAHALILFLIVTFSHHPPVFLGLFLLFMGIASAYPHYQERLILREGLLVAYFLSGLVVLGGMQEWWLKPALHAMDATTVYFGATALTAVTDNAALTFLGTLVPDLTEEFKYSLVAGAVTGGGLTVIA